MLPALRDAQWYADRAKQLLKAGDFENAARMIEKAEPRFGDSASVRLVSAKVNSALGDSDAVRSDLERISADTNASFKDRLAACELYQLIDDDDAALKVLEGLFNDFGKQRRVCQAYNTALHIHKRRGDLLSALDAGINAATVGGKPVWATMIQLIEDVDQETLSKCSKRMRELENEGIINGDFYKLMSLFDTYAGQPEAMLEHVTRGAKSTFERLHPMVPWVDEAAPLQPKFLILGSMKCGSTSLFDQISRHPLFLIAMSKELQFFQHKKLDDQWYLHHFPRVSPFPGFFSGEGSPGYFGFPIVDRVKNLLPEVKLLFIKRDPVARAISHYRHNTRLGMNAGPIENVLNGIDELQAELLAAPERAEDILLNTSREHGLNAFLVLGCYEILMRRWYAAFPSEQILELELEDLHASPQETMDQVFTFLEVDSIDATLQQSNQGDYVKTDAKTQRVMRRLREFYDVVDTLAK